MLLGSSLSIPAHTLLEAEVEVEAEAALHSEAEACVRLAASEALLRSQDI